MEHTFTRCDNGWWVGRGTDHGDEDFTEIKVFQDPPSAPTIKELPAGKAPEDVSFAHALLETFDGHFSGGVIAALEQQAGVSLGVAGFDPREAVTLSREAWDQVILECRRIEEIAKVVLGMWAEPSDHDAVGGATEALEHLSRLGVLFLKKSGD